MNELSAADIRRLLDSLKNPVRLKVITTLTAEGYRQCPACEDTASLVEELAKGSDLLAFEEISIIDDVATCKTLNVTRAPTVLFENLGIRYTGAPMGLETSPFIYTIYMASTRKTIFSGMLDDRLENLKEAKLELIVTPTCPYCSQAALIENSIVIDSNGRLTIDIIESYENPDIARKYGVTGVPVTIINGSERIEGVPSLELLFNAIGYKT